MKTWLNPVTYFSSVDSLIDPRGCFLRLYVLLLPLRPVAFIIISNSQSHYLPPFLLLFQYFVTVCCGSVGSSRALKGNMLSCFVTLRVFFLFFFLVQFDAVPVHNLSAGIAVIRVFYASSNRNKLLTWHIFTRVHPLCSAAHWFLSTQ